MGRMLSPSDLEHYQQRGAQRLLWRNLSSRRRRLLLAGQRPLTPTGAGHSLYFGLLGHFQGVIDLDAEITNRTLQLRVS
jgi:hypothetical protein